MNLNREKAINMASDCLKGPYMASLRQAEGCSLQCNAMINGVLAIHMDSNNLLHPTPKAPFPGSNYTKIMSFTPPSWSPSTNEPTKPNKHFTRSSAMHSCAKSIKSIFGGMTKYCSGLEIDRLELSDKSLPQGLERPVKL